MNDNNLETLIDNELLGNESATYSDTNDSMSILLTIDEPTRKISYSGAELLLGVENDFNVEKICFQSPRYVADDLDLAADTAEIRVVYINGNRQTFLHQCVKEDVSSGDTVTFSWRLTKNVTVQSGNVSFLVCVKNIVNGVETHEWHTVPFTGRVLDGIPVTDDTPEVIEDKTSSMYALSKKVDELEVTVTSVNRYTKEEIDSFIANRYTKDEVNALRDELLATHDKDFYSLSDRIDDNSSSIYNNSQSIADLQNAVNELQNAPDSVGVYTWWDTQTFTNKYSVSHDIKEAIDKYNELMVVVRIESNGNSEKTIGISEAWYEPGDDSEPYYPYLASVTNNNMISYTKLAMNKVSNGNRAWTVISNNGSTASFGWDNDPNNLVDKKYITVDSDSYISKVTIVICGR